MRVLPILAAAAIAITAAVAPAIASTANAPALIQLVRAGGFGGGGFHGGVPHYGYRRGAVIAPWLYTAPYPCPYPTYNYPYCTYG